MALGRLHVAQHGVHAAEEERALVEGEDFSELAAQRGDHGLGVFEALELDPDLALLSVHARRADGGVCRYLTPLTSPQVKSNGLVNLAHLWSSPFSSSGGTYYQEVPVARHMNWCLPPPFYCVSTTGPGNYQSNASDSNYFFNRWVPLDAQ